MPSHVIDSVFFKDLYGTPAMRAVFDDMAMLQKWLDVEAALARAEADLGLIPAAAAEVITRTAQAENMDVESLKRGIDKTVHPLVALVWQLSQKCAGEAGKYVHWGATTQDVMDTALVLQLKEAAALLESTLADLIIVASELAQKYRDTVMAGRTHGQQALPITFGYKVAVWVAELRRHQQRLNDCKPRVLVGQFGGAVGTLAGVVEHGIAIHNRLMHELGLYPAEIAWHTSRDGFAELASILTMLTATTGKIAHEIIDLQKLEFGEVEEPFDTGKVGSSTMPQKRNPMLCEAILTLARLTRTQATTGVDAMLHEHERDWSSVQMEWAYLPQLCIMTHGALNLMLRVLRGLKVNPDAMARNLSITRGTLLAERVMLELGQHIGRQHAHDVVYEAAMESYEKQREFADVLKANTAVMRHFTPDAIDALLDPAEYTGLSATFVDRVTGK